MSKGWVAVKKPHVAMEGAEKPVIENSILQGDVCGDPIFIPVSK